MFSHHTRYILTGSVCIVLAALSMGYAYYAGVVKKGTTQTASAATAIEREPYVLFDMEIYDIIQKHYWQKATDADLSELFRLSLAQARGTGQASLPSPDRMGTEAMLADAFAGTQEDKKKALAVDIGILVVSNLAPQGRSGLMTTAGEKQLRDTVNNIDANTNLYDAVGVPEGSPPEVVQQAYEEIIPTLQASSSPEAQEAIVKAERAVKVLTEEHSKAIYDSTKMEPSVVHSIIGKKVLYVDLAKVTPATLEEFVNALESTKDNPALSGLIIDVRSNVGGTLDFAKFLFALFVGPQQYAFDLFVQGELKPERTPGIAAIPSLKNFKDIAILTDNMTQSTAELTTVIFKRFNRAKVIGRTTRGWGTVENTYPIQTRISDTDTYTILLVNALTLREDNTPIEGRGVDPDVSLDSPSWKNELRALYSESGFASAVEQALAK